MIQRKSASTIGGNVQIESYTYLGEKKLPLAQERHVVSSTQIHPVNFNKDWKYNSIQSFLKSLLESTDPTTCM